MATKQSLDRTARRILRLGVGALVLLIAWLVSRQSVGTVHTVAQVFEGIGFLYALSGAIPILRGYLGVT